MGCMIRAKLEVNTVRLKKLVLLAGLVLLAEVSTASRVSTASIFSHVFLLISCYLHFLSTPTLSPAEPSREPMMRRYLRELRSSNYMSVDSPTAESPGYVTESDPKEDLEEYEDDETKDERVNTWVTKLVELHEHDTQDLYALLEDASGDSIDGGGGGLCFPRGLGSLDRIESGDSSGSLNLS
ncbi:hypothetical protein Tco_0303382 [Tanacetum coccineum]